MKHIVSILVLCRLWIAYGAVNFYPRLNESAWDASQANYLLWTRLNYGDTDFYPLEMSPQSISDSRLNVDDKTYFLYHGFGSQGNDYWILDFKDEILATEQANIISVNYGHLAKMPDYFTAVSNVYKVANQTAIFIDWMSDEIGLDSSRIHLIGYSLGAHVAGMTGAYLLNGKIDRITGLDPAGPMFYITESDRRIDKSHAEFVDIIHTNAGSISEKCYGLYAAVGHVDFYPNGGKHQPGCNPKTDLIIDCSHARAPAFFIESVRNSSGDASFFSWPCSNWETYESGQCNDCMDGCQNMGMNANRESHGSFYLTTNADMPYSIDEDE